MPARPEPHRGQSDDHPRAGRDIRVNINGQDVIQIQDDSRSRGLIGFGAITWAGPATFNFDNILVTVP